MADSVATLYVEVNAEDAKRAVTALSRLERESKKTERQNKKLAKSSDNLGSAMQNLAGFAAGLATAFGVAELVQAADTYTLIENRLKLVTESTLELADAQQEVFKLSQDSRASFESTADLYSRLARSTEQLGTTQTDLLIATEAVNKAFIVSGSSANEAQAAVIQLGQGLASGALRGDELRSVLEQAPRLARALADGLGITVGQLRELGAAGELTTEKVFNALIEQAPQIAAEFEKMDATVAQAGQTLSNSLVNFVGKVDDATGLSSGLAESIIDLSGGIDRNAQSFTDAALGASRYIKVLTDIIALARSFDESGFDEALDRSLASTLNLVPGLRAATALFELLASEGREYREEVSKLEIAARSSAAALSAYNESLNPEKVKEVTGVTGEYSRALQRVEDKIAQLNAVESKNAKAKIEAKYISLSRILGENNPKLKELVALELELLQIQSEQKAKSVEGENAKRRAELVDGRRKDLEKLRESGEESAEEIESAFTRSFSSMEDAFTDFVSTGQLEFGTLVDSILADLIRIQVQRSITEPLSGALSSFTGDLFSGIFQANGGAWNNGVQMFANGGVVDRATPFGMAGGGYGVMGEAGPELITPLEKKGGVLGISQAAANVNVYVENAPEGTTATSQPNGNGGQDIRVVIADITDQNLASGRHDNVINQNFGITRIGY